MAQQLPRDPSNLAPRDPANRFADYSVNQMYEFLSNYELTRDVGAKYEYSNAGGGCPLYLIGKN